MNNKNRRRLLSLATIIFMVGIDQLIKYFVDLYLKPIGSKMLIPNVLQLHYLENDGAMMGMMSGKTEIMTIASVICFVGIFVYLFVTANKGFDHICLVSIAAGGLGNIIDRIFRGYVIDYIEVLFVDFYIFNFGDCLVTCGAFALIFYEAYTVYKDYKNKKVNTVDG